MKYACVHGHFYQPPRENPWTEEVERQIHSGPDRDWNERIARECYAPNARARVVDGRGRILDVVDNYAWMSFDFGPTLLSWLERRRPGILRDVAAADRESARRLDGHGNGMAQAFHHPILPLAHPRDRRTEILWGLADFRRRFGRRAEGLWLPECGADDATLAGCARLGVRFVILAPHQAAGPVKPGRPYWWSGGGARLAVFFYDAALSHGVAFEKVMSDSRAVAHRIATAISGAGAGMSLIATDGENYGHHEHFAEMGLAHLLRYALPGLGVQPVNPAWYLAKHPPAEEVRLVAGGSSWSCAHGVERWRSDCGCGAVNGKRQAWRAPLREALEGLRGRLAALYEEKAAGLISDPWGARDAYIEVVLDRDRTADFLARHAPGARGAQARVRALKLLELQRRSLMMFTSCGWFFEELSRLEPVQNLRYAARALELAREFGAELEPDFVRALSAAPSNDPHFRDGAGVWEKLVKPAASGADEAAARLALSLLFERASPPRVHGRLVSLRALRRSKSGRVAGRAELADAATGERQVRAFAAARRPGARLEARVRAPSGPWRSLRLNDLGADDREKILGLAVAWERERWESQSCAEAEELLSLAERFRGLPLPPELSGRARLVLGEALAAECRKAAGGDRGALAEFRALLERALAAGLELFMAESEEPWSRLIARRLDALERGGEPALRAFSEAASLGLRAGLHDWRASAQVRFFAWLKSREEIPASARALAETLGLAL